MEMESRDPYQNVIGVENETTSHIIRQTVGGRKLRYELNVLQQPKQARACGQGAKCKSSRSLQ